MSLDCLFIPLEPEAWSLGSHPAIGKFARLGKDGAGNVEMLKPMGGRRYRKHMRARFNKYVA